MKDEKKKSGSGSRVSKSTKSLSYDKKKTKSTQSSRRHAFSSFRERIDSIKIDPNLTLTKRSFDDAEVSHFLSTLDHWKEINISKNFSEFLDKVENKCQSLPQLIHHQQFIFDSLCVHIELNDVFSIQPLFELLGQFVHDLGVDFLDNGYYLKTLDLIMKIALATNPSDSQNNRNTSNVLEWSFNSLAFIFKYLSRSLVQDLLPTFNALFPLLKLNTKRYISRYCAEALSFLLRKSKDEALDRLITKSLDDLDLLDDNESYAQSLIIMYSESMKSINGSFHTKSKSIFVKLLDHGLKQKKPKHISLLSDIILNILNHGSLESCDKFYKLSVDYLSTLLDDEEKQNSVSSLISISQILLTLSFAESGKKITSWEPILLALEKFLNLLTTIPVVSSSSVTLVDSLIYLLAVVFRNCPIQQLTKYQHKYFEIIKSIDGGKSFFKFVETSMDLCDSKMNSFGITKQIQDFINTSNCDNFMNFSVLISEGPSYSKSLIIPYGVQEKFQNELQESFKNIDGNEFDIYWRLLILEYSESTKKSVHQFAYFKSLFKQLISKKKLSKFDEDIAAEVVKLLTLHSGNDSDYTDIVQLCLIETFEKFGQSPTYVGACASLLSNAKKDSHALEIVSTNFNNLVNSISTNLALPNHEARFNSIKLIIKIHELCDIEVPQILSDIRLVEGIPLSLSTGRDLSSRIRNLGIEFKKLIKPTQIEIAILTRYLFGLLTNKFQPCWLAVFEVLPQIASQCSQEIWRLSNYFINLNYENQTQQYTLDNDSFSEMEDDEDLVLSEWLANDSRLAGNFNHINKSYFTKYANVSRSLLQAAQYKRGDFFYSEIMRSQTLQALGAVPQIAESHSEILVPLVLHKSDIEVENENEEDEEIDDTSSSEAVWNLKDRNSLVGLFSKFNNLKRIHKSDEFYQHMLKLLCNKQVQVQKMALSVVLNWKIGTLNKYRDNLQNLLDNTIFKDEISKFITRDSESKIEDQDLLVLMPIILRILFGRAQSAPKSNSQSGRKFAVITVLPNLSAQHIAEFLKLGSERIGMSDDFSESYFQDNSPVTLTTMRRINGFVKLLNDVYGVLGLKYQDVLVTTIEPLLYSLVKAQNQIMYADGSESDDSLEKSARNVRQVGMKCLSDLFALLGDSFDWDDKYVSVLYSFVIKPRLGKFAQENLQQTSSLMRMMTGWIDFTSLTKFYTIDDFAPVQAILSLLENENCKDSVLLSVLTFASVALNRQGQQEDSYYSLMAQIVNALLATLPSILDRSANPEVNSKGVDILLLLLEQEYVSENETIGLLIDSLTRALDKPHSQISPKNKVNVLKSLSSLIERYDCEFEDIQSLYHSCSKALRIFKEKNIRETLVKVFDSFGEKFEELKLVSELVAGLNSYSGRRMEEYNFEERLASFKIINDELYLSLTTTQWFPILNCALYFINDELELAIRTNATFTLNRFIDAFSQLESFDAAKDFVHLFKDSVLPNIRNGLRYFASKEVVQTEYISVLSHAVQYSKHFDELDDMKILLFNNDEEANFFSNVNHIQLHRRQRAVKRLRDYRFNLSENSISHYILPIIEHYAFCTDDEKLRNIANETVDTISDLAKCISWNQYRALFRRYIGNLKKSKPEDLRDHVSLIVSISRSMENDEPAEEDVVKKFTRKLPAQAELDNFILEELFPSISKILNVRNDETIVSRIRLAEALTNLITNVSENLVESHLPSILTSTCQVIRSRSEELRDAVRKSLGRISNTLGTKYFKFILQELKTSLSRGSQIHVLSFTIHHLIVNIQEKLQHSDLDESSELLVNIIMEDIFGAAGQEKDAEGYTSKMKEVKFNKSFDTGELLAANISLTNFKNLISPVKMLLKENVSLKVQNKLDELLRRYALGLNHNSESSKQSILILCYEIHQQSQDMLASNNKRDNTKEKPVKRGGDGNAGHFIVKLNAKPLRTHVENTSYITTLQKFSFELLRTAISRHENEFLNVSKLQGFIPLLENALQTSDNEGVIISCLKVLNIVVRLPFSEDVENSFKACSRRALNIVKDCPTTNSELCQACLRFLSTIIRHKPEIQLKETAVSYILIRIQPDLEEPNRQGLAFAFLKAILSQHIMIPEVYDIMDKVSKIMIVNHSKEIRDMSRSAYFQFLMEYDQGRGRLEKQFKFLLNNLSYSTQDGRSSVMELIHLIIMKAGVDLISKLSSSFFIGLANVMVSDESPKCREMATTLLSSMFKKLGSESTGVANVATYCSSWLSQSGNRLLQRCGLQVYKLFVAEFGYGKNKSLDDLAIKRVQEILSSARNKDSTEDSEDVEWEIVYSSLSVFSALASSLKESVFSKEYASTWKAVLDSLLYPHSWVRLISCRLVGILLANLKSVSFELSNYEIQTIAYRLLHQLGAPSIAESLGTQIAKNLVLIGMKWEKEKTPYEFKQSQEDEEEEEGEARYKNAMDYLVSRVSSIMRQENNYRDSFVSKKSSIQLAAMLVQIISSDDLPAAAKKLMLGMYNFSDLDPNNSEAESELVNLSSECNSMIESKLGVTEYTQIYTQVKQIVNNRRQERKNKRAQLNITAPDIAAKRKMRKHERFREKRKHEKDENGYYKSKRNKFS